MKNDSHGDNPLHIYFTEVLHDSLSEKVGHPEQDVERYLADLLVSFAHLDQVYALKDKTGHQVTVVSDMIAEGDIRLNADSFARERQVHRYIGDFLMFWSGLFPEQLKFLKSPAGKDALLDPIGQGRLSYYIASTFTHEPYQEESRTLQKLSEGFDVYCKSLTEVRQHIVGLPNTHIC